MPGQTYVNPYNPMTPIGAGLQNIAAGLFSGNQADARHALRDYTQQGGMYDAHGELYREQAHKATIERKLAERLLADQGYDAQTDVIGNAAAMPGRRVRAMRDIESGAGDTSQYSPQEWDAYRQASLAVRPAYADKTINPVNIAQALEILKKRGDVDKVIAGTQPAATVGQAHAAADGKPLYHIGEAGAGNLFTGSQALNPIGVNRAERERQHARTYKLEADSGVHTGAPVMVDDPEAGIIWTAPSSAIGRRAVSPATLRAGGAGNGTSETTTQTDLPFIRPQQRDNDMMLDGIDRAVGGKLADKMLEGRALERAQQYYSTPGSPHYGNHEAAGRQAVIDIMPKGAEQSWLKSLYSDKGFAPIGGATEPGAVNLTAPTVKTKTVTKGSKPQDITTRVPSGTQPAAPRAPGAQQSGVKLYSSPSGKTYTQKDVEFTATKRGLTTQQVVEQLKLREGT